MKKNILTVVTLTLIAAICGLLLKVVNDYTSEIISDNLDNQIVEAAQGVYASTSYIETNDISETTYVTSEILCYDEDGNLVGVMYQATGSNSFGTITLLVAISDSKIIHVEFLTLSQSYAKIAREHTEETYNENELTFSELADVDVSSGATYSSTTIKNIILECSEVYGDNYEK